ncbi:MAG: hypothetical protein OEM06_07320 [Desulfobacteraceae bacterium]|nr:hypothetical protein [Desulfobacteraceae bacterium]MDH3574945.1 hypothetical protein [Desulfobacteraceae bacterium]MDH3721193.1 hypothetical protein [Desulfobacteraceae bacterium]MDH3838086.1 hypothetical protein [Desulfobacteraceae bacterium]MDH3875693.1 hypothetical protein [Desulfobacteraceae bacterium]
MAVALHFNISNNVDLVAGASPDISRILEACTILADDKLLNLWVNPLDRFDAVMAYLVCLSLPVLCASIRQCLADHHYSYTRLQRRPTDSAHRSIGYEQPVSDGKNAGDLC